MRPFVPTDTTGATPKTATTADPAQAAPARPHRWRHRAGRAVAVVVVTALAGAGLQGLAERRHATAHPAPGELIELSDGRNLHLQVAGEEHDGPTVLLFGGAGASVSGWGWVQPAIAEHATVVAYDRPGLGWSDPSDASPSADTVLADLREALTLAEIEGPYVLAGHSLGGHHARAFAAAHPDEVTGIVLIDPSHEHQSQALDMTPSSMAPMFAAIRAATQFGLTRLYLPQTFTAELEELPSPHREHALEQLRTTRYWATFGTEMVGLDDIGATLPTGPGALGENPLHVLIATGGATNDAQRHQIETVAELRRTMEQMSSNGRTTAMPGASHVSIVTDRVHAQKVADAIIAQVADTR